MELNFREYQPSDFNLFVEMAMGLYTKDGSKSTQMSAEKLRLTVNQLTSDSNLGEIIIFEENGQTIGYCILNRFWSNEFSGLIGYIDELFIQPNFRSKGVGENFFKYLELNQRYRFVAFMLETVESNPRAIQFYKVVGFELHHNLMLFKRLGSD